MSIQMSTSAFLNEINRNSKDISVMLRYMTEGMIQSLYYFTLFHLEVGEQWHIIIDPPLSAGALLSLQRYGTNV